MNFKSACATYTAYKPSIAKLGCEIDSLTYYDGTCQTHGRARQWEGRLRTLLAEPAISTDGDRCRVGTTTVRT